jgi:hypothetical protein
MKQKKLPIAINKEGYDSKWRLLDIPKVEYKKIYSRNRIKASTKLKREYPEEYSKIIKVLMEKNYRKILKTKLKKLKHIENEK